MTGRGRRKREGGGNAGAGLAACCILAVLGGLLASSCWNVDLSGLGGSAGGDAGGTGVGSVAGFGSVRVGGVDFSDDGVTTLTDDRGRGLADLVEGMRVRVRGRIEADFRSGAATSVTIEREVRGPVDDNGVSLDGNALRVLGQAVLVVPTTVMVQSGGGEFALKDLKDQLDGGSRPGLEIHGAVEDNGTIHAAFIGWEQDNVVADDSVALRGKIGGFDGTAATFVIGAQRVNYTGLPAGGRVDWPVTGLANGMVLDVRGYLDAVGGAGVVRTDRTGDRVAVLNADLGDAAERVTLEGYVLSGGSASFGMSVPGGTVTVKSGGTPTGDAFGLRKKVRVQGTLSGTAGTSVQASSVAVLKAADILLEGAPEGVPTAGDTMKVLGKTVETDEYTIFRDATGAVRANFGLASLSAADTVRVVGSFDNTVAPGKIAAARVDRLAVIPSGTFTLQGPVTAPLAAPVLSILGVNVVTDLLNTDYFDRGGVPLADQGAFFGKLALSGSGTVVRARNGVFTAGSSRIDPPSDGSRMEVEIVTIHN